MSREQLEQYLSDQLLSKLYSEIKSCGPIKSISVDITHSCNLRCTGCYYFSEKMDIFKSPKEEASFDRFIIEEKKRGTNFITIIGGEPSLALSRVKKLHDNFNIMVVTNGLKKIPSEGFENLPIGVSVWGNHGTDTELRGRNKIDIFSRALKNYYNDKRVIWYYTTTPGNAHQIENVVEQCVQNGNFIGFNFYGDIAEVGGTIDHRQGFERVRYAINNSIEKYPDKVLCTSYLSQVISTGKLYGKKWGYDVCGSITYDHPFNQERIKNGNSYNPHFRAYYADYQNTRRCCIGEARNCDNCYDVWAHMSWIMLQLDNHLETKQEFTNWLTTSYLFYLVNRIVNFEEGIKLLPEIHSRGKYLRTI